MNFRSNINSTNPTLPAGLGGSIPRPLNGSAASTGVGPQPAIAAILKAMANGGGSGMSGKSSRGPRGLEKPSLARSEAISRRLNGNPSRGTELKGL